MLHRSINSSGQKDWHLTEYQDRSYDYRQWIRQNNLNGFCCDIDLIKWKQTTDGIVPTVYTEITRCDDAEVGPGYLQAILKRYFKTEKQGKVMEYIAHKLAIPAYIVLFQKDLLWIWVYSLRRYEWRKFTPEKWAEHLRSL